MGHDQIAQVRQVADYRVSTAAQWLLLTHGNQADHRSVLALHELVRQVPGQLAGADDQRGPLGLATPVVPPGEGMQRHVGARLQGKAEHPPGKGYVTGEQFAGLGHVHSRGEAPQQNQPAAKQTAKTNQVPMLLVVDPHQGINGH
ncbi:hypothetical protein D9M68_594150 [compost metagenome]